MITKQDGYNQDDIDALNRYITDQLRGHRHLDKPAGIREEIFEKEAFDKALDIISPEPFDMSASDFF